jgi:transposase-like protein
MSILKQVPTKGKLRTSLKRIVFGSHVRCPACKSRDLRKIKKEDRWRCNHCDHPFSIKSVCWFKGSKLPLETIWILLWCWQKQIPIKQCMSIVGLSYPTVFNWYAKFRDKLPKELLETVLKNNIACDEMYTKGNSIIGAKEKGTRNIALQVIHQKSVNKNHAVDFLIRVAQADSNLFTDGSGIYKGIGNWHRLKHTYEIHKKFQFALTAEIEGLWGVFRTFIRRMYHHVTKYKLEDLVSEFCLRFRQHKIFETPIDYLQICLSPKPFAL